MMKRVLALLLGAMSFVSQGAAVKDAKRLGSPVYLKNKRKNKRKKLDGKKTRNDRSRVQRVVGTRVVDDKVLKVIERAKSKGDKIEVNKRMAGRAEVAITDKGGNTVVYVVSGLTLLLVFGMVCGAVYLKGKNKVIEVKDEVGEKDNNKKEIEDKTKEKDNNTIEDKTKEEDKNKGVIEIKDEAKEKGEKFRKKVSELREKYAQELTDDDRLKKYLEFSVGGMFSWLGKPISKSNKKEVGEFREVKWESLENDEDGKRKFDVFEFYVDCPEALDCKKKGCVSSVYRFGPSGGELDENGMDGLGNELGCLEDKYETGTAYLGVRFGFFNKGNSYTYYVHYDYKNPVRSYAHAISNAVFFYELLDRFEIDYYDFWFGMKGSYIYEGIGYLDSFKEEIKKKSGDRYEENEGGIKKLFNDCKCLEEYYYEVLKAREEILVKQGKK